MPPVASIHSVHTTICNNSISLPILIEQNKENVEALALIDSGAGGQFINKKYVEWQGFQVKKLNKPITPRNVDGTTNKSEIITSYTDLSLTVDGRTLNTRLLITELGQQKIILRYPWLQEHNPNIDWQTGEFNWRTRRPLKIKWYHEKPMKQATPPTNNKSNETERPIRSMEIDGSLKIRLHSNNAQLPTRGTVLFCHPADLSSSDQIYIKIHPRKGITRADHLQK